MSYVSKAAAVTPPVIGSNVWGFDAADVATATVLTVPESWKEAILTLEAQGEDFYFGFGTSALSTISKTAKSTISAPTISAIGSVPQHIEANTKVEVDMSLVHPLQKARIAIIADSGSSGNVLRVTRSSGYVG